MIKDFISLADFTGEQLRSLLKRASSDKALLAAGELPATLERKTLAMIFQKPSLRTRASFETAMTQLGGHAMYLTDADIGIGTRERVEDIARVLSGMCDGIMARTFSHRLIEDLARWATVPVINGLTDRSHPCQAMADLLTIQERFGDLGGRKIAFVGDGNNVARSLATACDKLGMRFSLACPAGYELADEFLSQVSPLRVSVSHDARSAVADADVVYTDTWVSMGKEAEKQARIRDFAGFQVNAELLAGAPGHAIVLHCLPAYRGCEITEDAFEGHAETILAESENRLHFQRTLLNVLLSEGGIP